MQGALARRRHEQDGRNVLAYYAGYLSHDFKDGFPKFAEIFPPPPDKRRDNEFATLQHNLRVAGAIAAARNTLKP